MVGFPHPGNIYSGIILLLRYILIWAEHDSAHAVHHRCIIDGTDGRNASPGL